MLVALTAAVAVWLYFTATRPRHEPAPSAWQAATEELNRCGAELHTCAMRYDHYATVATVEKRPSAARLFHALSRAETIHADNCTTALTRLGGTLATPTRITIVRGATDENIARSIADELQMARTASGDGIRRVIDAGNRYAARILAWAAATPHRHAALIRRLDTAADTCRYALCPTCGNLCTSHECPPYCPQCLTSAQEFIVIEN